MMIRIIFILCTFLFPLSAIACPGIELDQKDVDEIYSLISDAPRLTSKGAPILIDFHDYLCGYCKKSYFAIQQVRNQNTPLSIIFLPLGKLGPFSENIARSSLAAHEQGKYLEFHNAVMQSNDFPSEDFIQTLIKKLKLNKQKFEQDRISEKVTNLLMRNLDLMTRLNIKTIPSYLINNCHIPHSITKKEFESILQQIKN